MFDACEAVNDLIDEINEDYYESCYNAIYEELTERVESGEISLDEAEMVNETAAEKYLTESSRSLERKIDRIYNKGIKKYSKILNKVNKQLRRGNYDKAKEVALKDGKSCLEDTIKDLEIQKKLMNGSCDEYIDELIRSINKLINEQILSL